MSTWIKQHPLIAFFALAYAVSWAIEIPLALSARGILAAPIPTAIHYVASFGPATAALVVTALTEGWQGIGRLLGGLGKWRVDKGYYAFAVLAPVALFGLAVVVTRVIQGTQPDLGLLGQPDYLPYLGPVGVLALWLLTYGLGEEIGWRGFALPRLQRDRTAASSATILGLLWGGWHLPALFYRDTYMAMGSLALPLLLGSVFFASIVMTWLYNGTHGSLLLVVLFHGMFNWLSVSTAGGEFTPMIMGAATVAWAVFVMRRYGPENAAPVARQVARLPAEAARLNPK